MLKVQMRRKTRIVKITSIISFKTSTRISRISDFNLFVKMLMRIKIKITLMNVSLITSFMIIFVAIALVRFATMRIKS